MVSTIQLPYTCVLQKIFNDDQLTTISLIPSCTDHCLNCFTNFITDQILHNMAICIKNAKYIQISYGTNFTGNIYMCDDCWDNICKINGYIWPRIAFVIGLLF